MPEPATPALSEKGKAALVILRDTRLEDGIIGRDDLVMGVCALFREPLVADGSKVVSSLAPVSRNPRLAIETFLKGVQAVEAVLKPHNDIVRTSFGPLAGMNQPKAQQAVRDAIDTIKVEMQAQFGAQYDEVVRSLSAAQARRE